MDASKLKVYILIKDYVPVGHAVNCSAHASLAMWLKFGTNPTVKSWAEKSFKKVSCVVTPKQFEEAKSHEDYVVITESAFDDEELAIAFAPREEWPEFFKTLKLYR
jgi:hypothetical protein